MDVAGLVPGASEGKGLGNQFLDDLRAADVFIHIVDVSGETDIEGKPTKGHNPAEDIKFLEDELDKWYYNIFMKVWKSFARKADMEKQKVTVAIAKQFSGLKVTEEQVKDTLRSVTLPEKISAWDEKQIKTFVKRLRRISKPTIIAANKIYRFSEALYTKTLNATYKSIHKIKPATTGIPPTSAILFSFNL